MLSYEGNKYKLCPAMDSHQLNLSCAGARGGHWQWSALCWERWGTEANRCCPDKGGLLPAGDSDWDSVERLLQIITLRYSSTQALMMMPGAMSTDYTALGYEEWDVGVVLKGMEAQAVFTLIIPERQKGLRSRQTPQVNYWLCSWCGQQGFSFHMITGRSTRTEDCLAEVVST